MSDRLPSLRPRQVIRALEKAGWRVVRQRGSHISLTKEGMPYIVTVPLHRRDLPRGTLRDIIRDSGLAIDEFLSYL